jgi:hypothetical protein
LVEVVGRERPRQSPQPLRCINTGGQGANQLQLALGQDRLLGVKADAQAHFAALNGFNHRKLCSAGLLYAD